MSFHHHAIAFISELRRSVRALGLALLLLTGAIFAVSSSLIGFFQDHLHERLYFFSVAGPFLAHVKVSLFAAVYVLAPWFLLVLWKSLGRAFGIRGRGLASFVLATSLLFYAGTLFCFFVTLPYGVGFLLSFQSEELRAVISIGRFINFITIFILAFGLIFQLPVFMAFSARVGVRREIYEKNRRYAVLAIAVLAAVLTPTPDVINMALMGLPLYLLYEAGILVIRLSGQGREAAS